MKVRIAIDLDAKLKSERYKEENGAQNTCLNSDRALPQQSNEPWIKLSFLTVRPRCSQVLSAMSDDGYDGGGGGDDYDYGGATCVPLELRQSP